MTLIILLHSSKTMVATPPSRMVAEPLFESDARDLSRALERLSVAELADMMHISDKLAIKVKSLYSERLSQPISATVEVFRGDIYSGLRALDWTDGEKKFAHKHLRILSGLYGILRPYDGIRPYRLEAAYKLPGMQHGTLYEFWGDRLAAALPEADTVINLTSAEYAKLILPYLGDRKVIAPMFLSVVPGKDEPVFVAVHAKIARGAFARWLIRRGIESAEGLKGFGDLGYEYDAERSTETQPVFVCRDFGGIGLSQRLVKTA